MRYLISVSCGPQSRQTKRRGHSPVKERPDFEHLEAKGIDVYRGSPAFETYDTVVIDGRRRPETLSIAEFARLADIYAQDLPRGLTPLPG